MLHHESTHSTGYRPIPRGDLYRLLDCAALTLGLPDAVRLTAQTLIRYIPKDAPAPISPARVQELADERGLDPRTIRAHIARLIALGLAENRCLSGGHRCIRRRASKIVALHGIDFTPMLARRDAIEAEAAQIQLNKAECTRLRASISELRRRFRSLPNVTTELVALFDDMPRRYADRNLPELTVILDRMTALVVAASPLETPETDAGHPKTSDQSDENSRPNVFKDSGKPVLDLHGLLGALPQNWRAEMDKNGQETWRGLIATAYSRSLELKIPQKTWDTAVAMMGIRGTAALTLAADRNTIRNPAAWMHAMALRASQDQIDLTSNLLGPKKLRSEAGNLDSVSRSVMI